MRAASLLGLVFLLSGLLPLAAQEPFARNYDDEDGLADNEVYDLHFDREGFLWVGTDKGLCRFDGQLFKDYPCPQRPMSASAGLAEDTRGAIWCIDFRGNIYRQNGDSLHMMAETPMDKTQIYNLLPDEDGGMWAFSFKGSGLYRGDTLARRPDLNYQLVVAGAQGFHLFGEDYLQIDDEGREVARLPIDLENRMFNNRKNGFLRGGSFYLASKMAGGLYQYLGNRFKAYFPFRKPMIQMKAFGDTLYVGTRHGLDLYSLGHGRVTYLRTLLADHQISAIAKSPDGQLWVGTLEAGLFRFFDLHLLNYPLPETGKSYPLSLATHGTSAYLGSTSGRFFQWREGLLSCVDEQDKAQRGYALLSLDADTLLMASDKIRYYVPKTRSLGLWNDRETGYYHLKKLNKALYLSTWGGLYKSRGKGRTSERLLEDRFRQTCDFHGAWVLANGEKTLVFQPGAVPEKRYVRYQGQPVGASFVFPLGNFLGLVALDQQAVLFFDRDLRFREKLLLPDVGELAGWGYWGKQVALLGENRLLTIDPESKTTTTWQLAKGLALKKVSSLAILDSTLLIGHRNGLLVKNLGQMRRLPKEPLRFFPRQIQSELGLHDPRLPLELPSGKQALSLRFDLLNFGQAAAHLFYRVQGPGGEGQSFALGEEERRINLSALPTGNSTLLVEDAAGRALFAYRVRVEAPFWQKPWFLLVVLLFGVGLSAVLFRLRIRSVMRRNSIMLERARLEKELKASSLTSLRSQLNPHFMFNAMNSIQRYILKNDRLQASHYLGRFAELMRKTLLMSNQETVTLEEELEAIKVYLELEGMRFEGQLDYSIRLGEGLSPDAIEIPSLLVQPFVENAIKHGLNPKKGKRRLLIEVERGAGFLSISIDDNGIGRDAAAKIKDQEQHLSFSTEANKKRLDIINELYDAQIGMEITDKQDQDQRPSGTRVTLRLPLP